MNKDSSEPTEKERKGVQNLVADLSALKVYEPTFRARMEMLIKQNHHHKDG